ncbi:MAG: hypothetical protein JO267_01065 [Alphaproteobacteria bacterium]|nr:hypothetical protein [Alphaproteobacteria bacterium]
MTEPSNKGNSSLNPVTVGYDKHCFVVMPFGRNPEEQRWFRGWYETVIQAATATCGLEPVLAASEDQPSAINDAIRAHLVFDPMVIVDLGGKQHEDAPNPNVMYELGIRHAFGLPVVIMAWEGQRLPFDVSNQRAILSRRDFLDIEPTRQKLTRFLRSAQEGLFYNPMEAVGREAAIDTTSLVLGEESMLAALAKEVRELRRTLNSTRNATVWRRPLPVKFLIGRGKRTELLAIAKANNVESAEWGKFLLAMAPPEMVDDMREWTTSDWANYLALRIPEIRSQTRQPTSKPLGASDLSEDIIEKVRAQLPPQPWPTGIHKVIATDLRLTGSQVSRSIRELIARGVFVDQVNGVLTADEGATMQPLLTERERETEV